jgi:hypothetical protein
MGGEPMKGRKHVLIEFVLVLDATSAMQPGHDALREALGPFFQGLAAPLPDWNGLEREVRCKGCLLPFRDLRCDGEKGMVNDFPFVQSGKELLAQLEDPRTFPTGGGDLEESHLDALYVAASQSEWEEGGPSFRLLLSDGPARECLDPSTTLEGRSG